MTESLSATAPLAGTRITARALLLGDRLENRRTRARGRPVDESLAFRAGQEGFVALFRYGVAVLVGLSPLEEDDVIRSLRQRIIEFARHEEETATIELSPDKDDQIPPGGPIYLKSLRPNGSR